MNTKIVQHMCVLAEIYSVDMQYACIPPNSTVLWKTVLTRNVAIYSRWTVYKNRQYGYIFNYVKLVNYFSKNERGRNVIYLVCDQLNDIQIDYVQVKDQQGKRKQITN